MPQNEVTANLAQSTRTALPPLDLANLGDLYLVAKTLVDGLYQGRHATPERGGSTEFYDYRMYVPGESSGGIDWKIFGRNDRLYVRRFQHFGNLTLQIIIDGSASMDYPPHPTATPAPATSETVGKWQLATQLAAALALLATRQSESVALGIAVDSIQSALPAQSGFSHLYRIIHLLENFAPGGTEQLGAALTQAQLLLPRRRVIFVLSDFLGPVATLTEAVARLRFHGNDVCCLQILTPAELTLAGLKSGDFMDCENTAKKVTAEVARVQTAYTELIRNHLEIIHRNLLRCGAGHFLIKTTEHPLSALRRVLGERRQHSESGISGIR